MHLRYHIVLIICEILNLSHFDMLIPLKRMPVIFCQLKSKLLIHDLIKKKTFSPVKTSKMHLVLRSAHGFCPGSGMIWAVDGETLCMYTMCHHQQSISSYCRGKNRGQNQENTNMFSLPEYQNG